MSAYSIRITKELYDELISAVSIPHNCMTCEHEPIWGQRPFDADHGACRWPCPPCLANQMKPVCRHKLFQCNAWAPNSLSSYNGIVYVPLFNGKQICIDYEDGLATVDTEKFGSIYQVMSFIRFCTTVYVYEHATLATDVSLSPDELINEANRSIDGLVIGSVHDHFIFKTIEVTPTVNKKADTMCNAIDLLKSSE